MGDPKELHPLSESTKQIQRIYDKMVSLLGITQLRENNKGG
jgi:hypothetical protein